MKKGAGTFARALVVWVAAAAPLAWAGPDFKMADTLTCTIEGSSSPAEIGRTHPAMLARNPGSLNFRVTSPD
jgi:hypothetical protein